ncbi:hypothetical protein DAPPUDRAFT_235302 [Daphnia pulex]|uniref:Uncharacterized protein n=1 Tax=Daphnia pulex TaxID=6669 RepID=E9FYP5_DAPPU|nr:hypothetical protein DAPPUDRAFT_235302 [Daphnia pulex]|eukprot:EFX87564.1 hypothetical protein DAPPUDRAFT_235302 [Daphnia pulex]
MDRPNYFLTSSCFLAHQADDGILGQTNHKPIFICRQVLRRISEESRELQITAADDAILSNPS